MTKRYPKNMLEAALLLVATYGWLVFPAPPGAKRSYKSAKYCGGRRWGATNNPVVIARDFRRWPKANLGIPTGSENGFWALDIDTRKGHGVDGVASLRKLELKHGRLPKTLMAVSPTASLHHYFRYPADGSVIRNSTSKVGPGIDVRGEFGMVLAPPSVKPGVGRYRYRNWGTRGADAPEWLLKLVAEKPRRKRRPREATPKRRIDTDLIEAALNVIPAEAYSVWFEIGCALAFELGDAGFELFEAWSATSFKFNEAQCLAKWRECSRVAAYKIGTIFHHANEANPRWRFEHEQKQWQKIAAAMKMVKHRPSARKH